MSDDKFDAIVVGAGVAGSVAALVMARAGLDVLVIERVDSAGCKNMTGGRLYADTLEAIIASFAASALVMARGHGLENVLVIRRTRRYRRFSPRCNQMFRNGRLYAVLRNRLEPWLIEQALQACAPFITQGHTRENLLLNRRKRRYPRFSPRATRCSATRVLYRIA